MIKTEKTIGFTVRMPDSLRREIRRLAGASDMSMNEWIIQALTHTTGHPGLPEEEK